MVIKNLKLNKDMVFFPERIKAMKLIVGRPNRMVEFIDNNNILRKGKIRLVKIGSTIEAYHSQTQLLEKGCVVFVDCVATGKRYDRMPNELTFCHDKNL